MERGSLLKTTIELLRDSERPLNEIAQGAGVGYEWLRKFKSNLIPDPSINRVQALHDFLVSDVKPRKRSLPEARAS